MRPKISDSEWDKIVQDAFSAGAPEPHFSERYIAKRQNLERKVAMKEERKNAFQPGLVLATVGALLIAAVPMGLIWYMNRQETQTGIEPGTVVEETVEETTTIVTDVIPDLIGYRYEYAQKLLQQEGFQTDVIFVHEAGENPGSVLRLEPSPGMHCEPGSTVTLYVLQGVHEEFAMPDVTGLTQDNAAALLAYYGLSPEFANEPSDDQPGTVIAQSITPGTMVKNGDTVTLTVAIAGDSD